MTPLENQIAALIRQAVTPLLNRIASLEAMKSVRSPEQEIDAIPGRRVAYNLVGTQLFTATQDGVRGSSIAMTLSQDGPYVWTHYPLVLWRTTLPTNATNFGIWRPVMTYPLPDQVLDTDIVDISYEITDSGSQRNFQNEAAPAGMLSMPGALIKLAQPTLFSPNSTISFTPTYENILFNGTTVAPTEGRLVVVLPGYRIANL